MLRSGTLILCMMAAGCASPVWDGTTASWGTLREVMRFEKVEGRIDLHRAEETPDTVGLGALAGLEGEILVLAGEAWVCRAEGEQRPLAQRAAPGDRAALLVLADVPSWVDVPVEAPVAWDDLGDFVRRSAQRSGLDPTRPTPFLVEGPLAGVMLHVVSGRCPMAHPDLTGSDVPFRAEFGPTRGTLVGVFGDGLEGVLLHHGQRVHVHALLGDDHPLVGHVDDVTLAEGSVLRLPAAR